MSAVIGKTGTYKRTPEMLLNYSIAAKNRKYTEEGRLKISEARKKAYQEGRIKTAFAVGHEVKPEWIEAGRLVNLGSTRHTTPHSVETKTKISEGKKGKLMGCNNPNWIADRSLLAKRQERNDPAYKEWRKLVWIRDNSQCKINDNECVGRIEAHHIDSWKNFPELRYEVENGVTLCHYHHPRTRKNELLFTQYFKYLLN